MNNCKFVDANINRTDGTPSNIHVTLVKALCSIPGRGPIKVHQNWELHENYEIELCDDKTTQCFGLVRRQSAHNYPETFKTPRKHAIYGVPIPLMRSTARNLMNNSN